MVRYVTLDELPPRALGIVAELLNELLDTTRRIEERQTAPTPRLIRAGEAIELFGGTRAQFYALVRRGVIERIDYSDETTRAEPLYDRQQILAVIDLHRVGSSGNHQPQQKEKRRAV